MTTFNDFRVTAACGKYGTVRVSRVGSTPWSWPQEGLIESRYSNRFRYRWKDMFLTSGLLSVPPGGNVTLNATGPNGGGPVTIRLPGLGASVTGIVVADPCLDSTINFGSPCPYGTPYKVLDRLSEFLNLMAKDVDFYHILGDNFYDLNGTFTKLFFSRVQIDAQTKLFGAVPGNHDFFNMGHPPSRAFPQYGSVRDQVGYGFMQYYALDSVYAREHADVPFDFSVDPDAPGVFGTSTLPNFENFFTYYMVGGAGFIGFNNEAGVTAPAVKARFEEACRYFTQGEGRAASFVFLMGHWNADNDGCPAGAQTPSLYASFQSSSGGWVECHALATRPNRFFFFDGHEHANAAQNGGFLVGAQGSWGTGQWGFPVVDVQVSSSTEPPRLTVYYFPLSDGSGDSAAAVDARYERLKACLLQSSSWRSCRQYATVWLDVTTSPPTLAPTSIPSSSTDTTAIALGVTFGLLFLFSALGFGAWWWNKRKEDAKGRAKKEEDEEERRGLLSEQVQRT